MASPLKAAKPTVDLKAGSVSRIRRDPPPPAKKTIVPDRDQSDQQVIMIGVVAFAVALFVIILGISASIGWTPRQYTIEADL